MPFNIQDLRLSLEQFGLDPLEWALEIKAKRGKFAQIEICSLAEIDLRLEGWVRHGCWLNLSICEF